MDWLQYVGMACAAIIFIVLVTLAISLIRWLNASAAKKRAEVENKRKDGENDR